jgi:hypothetical protein
MNETTDEISLHSGLYHKLTKTFFILSYLFFFYKIGEHDGGTFGASMAILLGFTVSAIHLGFSTLESPSSFLLALQSCNPPTSSAIFPVTVTTF